MNRNMPTWCKNAKKAMIDKDISTRELADRVELTREYVTSLVNGKRYSDSAISRISSELNISNEYPGSD